MGDYAVSADVGDTLPAECMLFPNETGRFVAEADDCRLLYGYEHMVYRTHDFSRFVEHNVTTD